MSTFLHGPSIQYYRGIGPETQRIYPFSSPNLFIGENNAGKSIILDFLHERFSVQKRDQKQTSDLGPAERYRGAETGQMSFSICVPTSILRKATKQQLVDANTLMPRREMAEKALEVILSALDEDGHIWLVNMQGGPAFAQGTLVAEAVTKSGLKRRDLNILWQSLKPGWTGGDDATWLSEVVEVLAKLVPLASADRKLIPAKRQIGPKGNQLSDLSGEGLIDELAAIQSPDHDERHRKKTFDKINKFVAEVTDRPEAKIEIPHERNHILVHIDNKVLPLASLGTGIHEVILIAAFCTIYDEVMICMEEPEIHLHPVLQRKLIRYLATKTNNQYFIATHSAAFIDTPGATVFNVTNDGVQTRVKRTIGRSDKFEICRDLGYRASDLMQSNAILWVEGPSDRIYLRHWLQAVDDSLIEGIHYSIIYYGGGLVSHRSAEDGTLQEFIDPRALNQNIVVVIDSDKASPQSKLKPAVQRIKDELSDGPGVAWVTAGREIENYIPADMLHAAFKERHSRIYARRAMTGRFDHAIHFVRKRAKPNEIYTSTDKVKVAKLVCSRGTDLGVLDLDKRIREVVEMIRRANR